MLVTKCPRCGRPTTARLASPNEIVCVACGYDGPPLPDVVPTLEAAHEFVFGRNVRDRQISEVSARALRQNAPLTFGVLFVVACIPCTWSFANMVGWSEDVSGGVERFGGAVLAILPLVALCIYGYRSLLRVKRAQDDLRAACAALPPERKGDPARCRVCGGSLPAADAIVRCPFCATDNYSDLAVISNLRELQTYDATQYVFAVERAESRVEAVAFEQQKRAFIRGLAVWFLAGYPAVLIGRLVGRIELPTSHSGRYAFVDSRDGDCLERATTGSDLAALVGKKVHSRGNRAPSGVVGRVYSSFFGSFAVVTDDLGNSDSVDPLTLCLDETPSAP